MNQQSPLEPCFRSELEKPSMTNSGLSKIQSIRCTDFGPSKLRFDLWVNILAVVLKSNGAPSAMKTPL